MPQWPGDRTEPEVIRPRGRRPTVEPCVGRNRESTLLGERDCPVASGIFLSRQSDSLRAPAVPQIFCKPNRIASQWVRQDQSRFCQPGGSRLQSLRLDEPGDGNFRADIEAPPAVPKFSTPWNFAEKARFGTWRWRRGLSRSRKARKTCPMGAACYETPDT